MIVGEMLRGGGGRRLPRRARDIGRVVALEPAESGVPRSVVNDYSGGAPTASQPDQA